MQTQRSINELVGMQFIRNPWNVASTAWPTGCSLGFVSFFRGQQGLRRALLVPEGCMYLGACARYDETCPASQSSQSSADFRRCPLILEVSCITNLQPGTWITPGSFAWASVAPLSAAPVAALRHLQRLSECFQRGRSSCQGPVPVRSVCFWSVPPA